MIQRIIIFGDDSGIPQLLNHLDRKIVVGMVVASVRPHQHAGLSALASSLSIPLLIQPKYADQGYHSFLDSVRNLRPDLFFVNSYSMLLPESLLSIAPFGGINIHCALLPEYRGANPTQWALINGETKTGVSIHKMTPKLDDGDILDRVEEPIHLNDTWKTINSRLYSIVDQIVIRQLPRIIDGDLTGVPQNKSVAKQYPRRRPEDGKIDWEMPIISIYNLVRALVAPHPGAFYKSHDGKDIYLKQYLSLQEVVSLKYNSQAGGKILSNQSNSLILSPVIENDDKFLISSAFPESASDKIRFNVLKGINTSIPLTELTICIIDNFREAKIIFDPSININLASEAIRLITHFCITELHTPLQTDNFQNAYV